MITLKIKTEQDKEKVKNYLETICHSLTLIEAERDLVKDTVKIVSDEFEIPKKLVNKLAKVYYRQNFSEEVAVHDEFEQLYQLIVKAVPKTTKNPVE